VRALPGNDVCFVCRSPLARAFAQRDAWGCAGARAQWFCAPVH